MTKPVNKNWLKDQWHCETPESRDGIFLFFQGLDRTKIWRITRLRLAIQQKLAALENICVWTYKRRPRVIRLDFELNTYILDDYFERCPKSVKKHDLLYNYILSHQRNCLHSHGIKGTLHQPPPPEIMNLFHRPWNRFVNLSCFCLMALFGHPEK